MLGSVGSMSKLKNFDIVAVQTSCQEVAPPSVRVFIK